MIWDRPLALFLDVDGTLLDIARRPEEVAVPEDLGALLQSAWQALEGALALVSGRAIGDLDRLFAPLRLPAAGQHGIELRLEPDGEAAIMPARPVGPALKSAVEALALKRPGVELEDKGMTLAVHYRAAPRSGGLLARDLRRLLDREGEGHRALPRQDGPGAARRPLHQGRRRRGLHAAPALRRPASGLHRRRHHR